MSAIPRVFSRWSRAARAAVFILPAFFAFCGSATGATAPAAGSLLITNSSDYYNVPDDQKSLLQRMRMELLVYYYDPYWKLLWGESAGIGCYLTTGGRDLPLQAGQRVLIEGTLVPAIGILGENVKVTVLSEDLAPIPLDTRDHLAESARFDAHWVTIEGYVCRQHEIDIRHVELDVLSEGRLVTARLLVGDTEPIPQLLNARVEMRCVYVPTRDGSGQLQQISAWIPHANDISVLGWLDSDALFNRPQKMIEQIGTSSPGDWVHIAGELWSYDADHSITIRDTSGQVVIHTQQPATMHQGDLIEVVGHPQGKNLNITLRDPVFRIVPRGARLNLPSAPGRGEGLLKLRLAEQVLELRPEEAAQHFPAFLRGVVTWSDPKAGFFFLQDSSGGIRVRCGGSLAKPPPASSLVAVLGTSANGVFAPELELQEMSGEGPAAYPPAQPVTLDEAMTGSTEGERVEMRGYLREVEHPGIWLQLDLTTGAGEFTAHIPPDPAIEALVGSTVRVTGVCTALANAQRQLTAIRVWIADSNGVQVEEPRAADPFTAPLRTIANLRQFLAFHAFDHAVRLDGVVLYNAPGRYLYLQNGDSGLLVLHRDSIEITPGEAIEVVGFPGRDGSRLVLREAVWRHTVAAPQPEPLRLSELSRFDPDTDGRLVKVRGRVQDTLTDFAGHRLMMRGDGAAFEALLGRSMVDALPGEGSVLELTGVYALQYDEYRHPRAFQLQLRGANDIRVLQAAPWWTARRALTIAGGFAICTLFGVGWVTVLRRRVRQQTAQIRAQLETEARLNSELERAARLESLGVLAGGIAHDFNNLLTVIMANLGLAALDERVQAAAGDIIADAERGARRAAELTQQLLTFAKGGDPVRRAVALPDIVRESADFARHGAPVRCNIEVAPNLPPADVDQAQISRVVHNLVLNAAQAMPEGGIIDIRLTAVEVAAGEEPGLSPGPYVKLSVVDNGPGISGEHLARIFEPYFSTKPKNNGLGLATVHSIIKKHDGAIKVYSEVGHGTRFDIWLPAAAVAPDATPAVSSQRAPSSSARILFMDDEEVIRRAAEGVFRQLGHEATVVADGAQAIREYEIALQSGRRFDVVILDLTVPGGIGGLAAIEMLKRMDPNVRAIVSSGYSNDPVLSRYWEFGFSAVVPKPYEIDDLAHAIQVVIQGGNPSVPHPAPA